MSTTYAMYGVNLNDTSDYIGTTDNEPSKEDIDRWLEEYPAIVVSTDTLDEEGRWHSTYKKYDHSK